jgi:hypothetical protein
MVFVLVLLYHLLLIGGLALASGTLSGLEIALLLVLIGLGAAALLETEFLIEPRRKRRARRAAG